VEVISALLAAGANIKAKTKFGDSALTPASLSGNVLTAAALSGNPETIPVLIKAGANIKDPLVLMSVARRGKKPEMVYVLVKAGAKINATNDEGRTPLMAAVLGNQSEEVISSLLKCGADIRARDKNGMTALLLAAAENPNPQTISVLLKHGASVNDKDKDGVTALMKSIHNRYDVIVELLKKRADIKAKNNRGETALSWAAQSGNPKIMSLLLESGASIDALSDQDKLIVQNATKNGFSEKIKDAWWSLTPPGSLIIVLTTTGGRLDFDVHFGQAEYDRESYNPRGLRIRESAKVEDIRDENGYGYKITTRDGKIFWLYPDHVRDNVIGRFYNGETTEEFYFGAVY
jgi:ankyrin repeat protein